MILQQHHITFVIVTESENMEYWTKKILTVFTMDYGIIALGFVAGANMLRTGVSTVTEASTDLLWICDSLRLIWIYDTMCGWFETMTQPAADLNLWHSLWLWLESMTQSARFSTFRTSSLVHKPQYLGTKVCIIIKVISCRKMCFILQVRDHNQNFKL